MINISGNFICESFSKVGEEVKGVISFTGKKLKKETIFFYKKISSEKQLEFYTKIFSEKNIFNATGNLYKGKNNIFFIELKEIIPLALEINILKQENIEANKAEPHIEYGETVAKSNFVPPKRYNQQKGDA